MEKKPYYITTAIAYTSGKPHIGNTYEIVLADSIARFKRQEGYDVRFQTRIMRNRYRKSSKNCTTKVIFIKVITKECIVLLVNHFLLPLS